MSQIFKPAPALELPIWSMSTVISASSARAVSLMTAGVAAPQEEMINVFNLGIGYCIVTSPNNEENIHNIIEDLGFRSWTIGEVVL